MQNMEKRNLLYYIQVVSFAALDASLYLDTHPDDEEAMNYYRHFNKARQEAVREYAHRYGPLNPDQIREQSDEWQWTCGKWPWEGGC